MTILLVDDEPNLRKVVTVALEAEGHQVIAVGNTRDALAEAGLRFFDLAFVDLRLGTESGMELVTTLRSACPWMKVIVITAYATIDTAVDAMRRGAFDYLPKPFSDEQVALLVNKVGEVRLLEKKVAELQEAMSEVAPEADLATRSPAMERLLDMARKVADSQATVLIRGESGTGKTILARAIHSWSSRAHNPFGLIACPSLSAELLESELFGHMKGAFTGASSNYPGRIAGCEGGTLFLDEIGDLPLSIQPKLLRLLQEKAYERIGDLETHKADVRILAATNMDIEAAIKAGRFRQDLYYRLNVVELVLPPLRDRREDIIPLAERMIAFFAKQNHRRVLCLSQKAGEMLQSYNWPGNVRELRNAIERAVLLCTDERICVEHLPMKPLVEEMMPRVGDMVSLEKIEEMHIRRVLAATKSLDDAGKVLGMDSVTLWRRRKKYGI